MTASVPTPPDLPLQLGGVLPETQQLVNEYAIPAVLFTATLVVVYLLGRMTFVPLVRRLLDSKGHDPSVKSLGEDVAGVVNVVLAFAVAFTVAGFGSVIAAFATLGGALALAVGFAAQDLLGNFVAGVFILKDKPFEVGDWIQVNDIEGRVEDIDLRVSRIRTFDNERITVPNSELANNALTNPVAFDKLRQTFTFGIGYDDDIDHAREVILDEAAKTDGIMGDPAPMVRVTELADSYVGLKTFFWFSNPSRADYMETRSNFVQRVKERLDAETIEMPYPYRTLEGELAVDAPVRSDGQVTADD